MPPRREISWVATEGYHPNQLRYPGIPGTLIHALNLWFRGAGKWESSGGVAASGSNGGVRHLQTVGGTHGGMSGSGSVIRFFASNVYGGSGTAFEGGVALGAAGSTLTIKPLAGAAKSVGVAAPAAPVISDGGVAGLIDGTASIRLTAVSDLGEESNASAPSNVISVTLKKIHFTTPALPSGATRFAVYCPRSGFGSQGPHFRQTTLGDIAPGTYDIDWTDSILGAIAPIDNDPPPACTFAGSLNNILLAIGAYGDMIAPSKAGDFGAFPPDWPVSLGAPPTGVKDGLDDSLLISTATSVMGCRASGDVEVTPVALWTVWPTVGFSNMSAWWTHLGDIWGFSGQRGPVTSAFGGEPNGNFAQPVESDFVTLGFSDSNTCGGYDPRSNAMVFISGTTALPFMLGSGKWSGRQTLPATIVTAATVGNALLLGASGGQMYILDSGAGTAYELIPWWQDVGEDEMAGTICRVAATINAGMTVDVLTEMDESTSRFNASLSASHSGWKPCNVQMARSVTMKLSGTGAGHIFRRGSVLAIPHRVTKP